MNDQSASLISVPAELTDAIAKAGLMAEGARSLQEAFAPHFLAFHEVIVRARAVQPNQPKAAREVRLELRAIRIAGEKTKDALKSDILLRGRAIDGCNNILKFHVQPLEQALEAIEQAEERAEFARVQKITLERAEHLRPYADPSFYALGQMPEDTWQQLLAGARAAKEAQLAAAARLEEERLARVKAEAEERARLAAENVRLMAVAAEERRQREAQEAEGRRLARQHEERLQREEDERAHHTAMANAERDRLIQQERQARLKEQAQREVARQAEQAIRDCQAEVERQERLAEQRRLQEEAAAERAKREKAEAALAKKQAAEAKKKRDEAAATKRAAAAPDRAKLEAMATAIRDLAVITLNDPATTTIVQAILLETSDRLIKVSTNLGATP